MVNNIRGYSRLYTQKNIEEYKLALDQYFEDDGNHYVSEPLISTERTWSQAQNYTVTKNGRIYLGFFYKGGILYAEKDID